MSRRLLSTLLSGLVLPGAGQLINRHYIKGSILIVLTSIDFIAVLYLIIKGFVLALKGGIVYDSFWAPVAYGISYRGNLLLVLVLIMIVLWLYSTIDAYHFGGEDEGDS